ncbi:MAG: twin-arginine translocase TatA/TatE family subunit [Actinobacteria bacterium]|nr:twin-arginine translocase TatA/TatE family subunit [Actinomycetota bacterium]
MFDIGIFEFVAIGVVALLVFGPERLPRVTAQASHWLRQLREQAQSARQTLTESIDVDSGMLKDLADLHPRNIARSVMEPVTEATAAIKAAGSELTNPSPTAAPPTSAPFDPDAT